MIGILIFTHVVVCCLGIVIGMYASSQIEKDINKRITK